VGVGTPQWTAPEVHVSGNYGVKSDVYSYGVLLWEIWHKMIPFGNLNQSQIILGVVTQNMRPPVAKSCPKEMAQLMVRCWQTDPNKRPTLVDVIKELDNMQGSYSN
jgi:serine/threonine protein kinase